MPEIEIALREKKEELRKFRFEMTGSKIKNVKHGMALRKGIARILTILNNQNNK